MIGIGKGLQILLSPDYRLIVTRASMSGMRNCWSICFRKGKERVKKNGCNSATTRLYTHAFERRLTRAFLSMYLALIPQQFEMCKRSIIHTHQRRNSKPKFTPPFPTCRPQAHNTRLLVQYPNSRGSQSSCPRIQILTCTQRIVWPATLT
jgi:hypothetical protein